MAKELTVGWRDTGVYAIEQLMEKKGAFDYILLETTGLADPGNLAPLFWLDEGLGSTIYLDGIVTLVDAKNIIRTLDCGSGGTHDHATGEQTACTIGTAHVQISHADVIIINKSDLVDEAELRKVKERILSINGLASIHVTHKSELPQLEGILLDLHAYERVSDLDVNDQGHTHLDPVMGHRLHKGISTVSIPVRHLSCDEVASVDSWLRSVLWNGDVPGQHNAAKFEIHRLKGRLLLDNGTEKLIQAVRETYEIVDSPQPVSTAVEGKLVLIGRQIRGIDFAASLHSTLGPPAPRS